MKRLKIMFEKIKERNFTDTQNYKPALLCCNTGAKK